MSTSSNNFAGFCNNRENMLPAYFELSDGSAWSCGYVPSNILELMKILMAQRREIMTERRAVKSTINEYYAYLAERGARAKGQDRNA